MIEQSAEPSKVFALFEGWKETMIWACLEKGMGKVFISNAENPCSASACVGVFGFLAGKPDRELIDTLTETVSILIPQSEEWAVLIEERLPTANRVFRYAMRTDPAFDVEALQKSIKQLPEGYRIARIDSDLYDRCLENPVTAVFVSAFDSKEHFLSEGRGVVVVKDGNIVSGASSYSRYSTGIEVEVDTIPSERKKHLATAACSALILNCLEEGLYPSWDAQNTVSVHLAEKLGYRLDHQYPAYEIRRSARP